MKCTRHFSLSFIKYDYPISKYNDITKHKETYSIFLIKTELNFPKNNLGGLPSINIVI